MVSFPTALGSALSVACCSHLDVCAVFLRAVLFLMHVVLLVALQIYLLIALRLRSLCTTKGGLLGPELIYRYP